MKKLVLFLCLFALSSTCLATKKDWERCQKVAPGTNNCSVSRTIINAEGRQEWVTYDVYPDGSERRVDPSEYRNAIDPGENDVVSIRKFGEDGFQVELASGRKERYCITKDGRLYKDDVGLSTCVR